MVDALEIGGVASHLASSLGRLSRSRYDLRVANLGASTRLSEQLRAMMVKVNDLDVTGALAFPRRVLALRRLIRALGIEMIHTYGHAGPVARYAAGKVPVISTVPEPPSSGGLGARLQTMLERRSASRAARLLVPSAAMKRSIAQDWGLDALVVPNFLDVPWFRDKVSQIPRAQARTRLGVGPDEVMLLHLGRGGKGKGLDVLLEALQVALVEFPRLRLFLTGEGGGMTAARTLAESLGLGDAVVFLGVVDDVVPLYAAADLYVLPSTMEGWSMGLVEAMAAGLPTVATRAGAITEVASDATAVLVESERPDALARAILKLAMDARRRTELGGAAANRAREMDVTVWAPKLEKIYAEVLRADAVG